MIDAERLGPSTKKIFLRLLVFLTLGNLLLVGVSVAWVDHTARALVKESETLTIGMLTETVSLSLADELVSGNYDAVEDRLQKIASIPQVAEITVVDPAGKVIEHLQRRAPGLAVFSRYEVETLQLPPAPGITPVAGGDVIAWDQIDERSDLGWVRIRFFAQAAETQLFDLRVRIFGLAAVGGLGMLALILLALRRSSRAVGRHENALLDRQIELQVAAKHDPLTGLPNRVALFERLPQAIRARVPGGQPLAICFLDLDGFKAVNDQWGHDMGDALLIAIARRLEHCVRDADMVVRLAGDEFVLLLDGEQHPGELHGVFERLVAAVGEQVAVGRVRITVGCSIGVMLCGSPDADPEVMLHQADEAMLEAKRAGRNRWVLHPSVRGGSFSLAGPSGA
jgi:diguanylate cyclase (GGDEF)-like protein